MLTPQSLVLINTLFNPKTVPYPLKGLMQIGLDEGLRLKAYQDEFGKWTIGLGHTPAYPGEVITQQQAYNIFIKDIKTDGWDPVQENFPWAAALGEVRNWVLVNMSYNMGINALLAFTDTLSAMQNGDLVGVINGMKESEWYGEVTTRARQLMMQYYTNEWFVNPLTSRQDRLLNQYLAG